MSSVVAVVGQAPTIPPYVAITLILVFTAALTLLVGLVRVRLAFLRQVPGVVFLIAGAALVWPLSTPGMPPLAQPLALMVAAAALVAHFVLQRGEPVEPRDGPIGSARAARLYLLSTLAVTAALLFYELGGRAAKLMTWEAPVVGGFPDVGGFANAFQTGQTVLTYTARRFLWDDGILSAGHTSLFYGAPAYALFHVAGFSPWTLRVPAAIAMLLSVLVMYAVGRRFFGPLVGAAAALLLGINQCALFYGRYGSSPAGTLLAVLLALLATWLFLDRDRSAWWMGGVCAAALYLATLQYSPARIVVLILLGFIALVSLCQWRRLWWQRLVGLAAIAVVAMGIWRFESSYQAQGNLLHARGEQYFSFVEHPFYIKELFGKDLLVRPSQPRIFTLADKLELLYRVIENELPEYAEFMGPGIETRPLGDGDPETALPHVYYAPLAVFIVWGLAHSLRRWRSWPHACLLLWLSIGTIPLLLTNRIDSHRIMLFVIPVTLWAALGVWEAARVMAKAKVPRSVQHLCAAALALIVVYSDASRLFYTPASLRVGAQTIAEEIDKIPGPVAVGALMDHGEVAWMQLRLLERQRQNPQRSGTLLMDGLIGAIVDRGTGSAAFRLPELRRIISGATVILAPAQRFREVATVLQNHGVRAAERGSPLFKLLRLDAGAAATGVSDADVQPLPVVPIPPTPTPIALTEGPKLLLTTLTPLAVTYGFKPPQVDSTWGGAPIIMGGVHYQHGLGTHAWCRMTYSVPPNAIAFQAIVGLSDEIRGCVAAQVTFEVRDDKDTVLFDSGVIDSTSTPMPVQVDVHGASAITLVVTEGGNGRDCDHANWALPAFLLQ